MKAITPFIKAICSLSRSGLARSVLKVVGRIDQSGSKSVSKQNRSTSSEKKLQAQVRDSAALQTHKLVSGLRFETTGSALAVLASGKSKAKAAAGCWRRL
jgi:hypothetical protein